MKRMKIRKSIENPLFSQHKSTYFIQGCDTKRSRCYSRSNTAQNKTKMMTKTITKDTFNTKLELWRSLFWCLSVFLEWFYYGPSGTCRRNPATLINDTIYVSLFGLWHICQMFEFSRQKRIFNDIVFCENFKYLYFQKYNRTDRHMRWAPKSIYNIYVGYASNFCKSLQMLMNDDHYSFSRVWFSISIPRKRRKMKKKFYYIKKYRSVSSSYAWQSYK